MGAEKVQQYLAFAANTETPNVRGTATFYAEQAQDPADPPLLPSLFAAGEQTEQSHAALKPALVCSF